MKIVSKSPKRLTFQKEKYVERCEELGKLPDPSYLDMYEQDMQRYTKRFDDPKSRVNNLEYDLLTTDWILEKVRKSETYAQNLYAAMCNQDFRRNDVWPILTEETWGCTWRYAGGIIADMRQEGDYIDWYCSGIRGQPSIGEDGKKIDDSVEGTVGEGYVTDEIREDLLKLGWLVIDDDTPPV